MTEKAYFYRSGGRVDNPYGLGDIDLVRTHWHADPLCSFIPRGREVLGPVLFAPVVDDYHHEVCDVCFEDVRVVDLSIKTVSGGLPTLGKNRRG
ncbi:hypothetical protein [Nocardioides sp. Iso805N]|uniref:hypothetical protein n=1 Tax=Nocardioides sp. Iso805N TaxID=1283287 RepID=UPI000368DFA4|nr:hypothetical protein [Nocardioides sp. Iso805N]